jgi:hypothetical protein
VDRQGGDGQGRPRDVGYPIRGIVKVGFLYLRNFEPRRWPAGNPEIGYLNCDGSPTKFLILEAHRRDPSDWSWALSLGRRPDGELYDLARDPDCVHNLAADPAQQDHRRRLQCEMTEELRALGNPRIFGNGEFFDRDAVSTEAMWNFYERYMRGEKVHADWVSPNDFRRPPLAA